MFTSKPTKFIPKLLVGILAITFLLSACGPTDLPATTVTENAPSPETEGQAVNQSKGISMDTGSIAVGYITTVVPATDPNEGPFWTKLPEHTVVTFDTYAIHDSMIQPQIYIFPLAELKAFNESTVEIIDILQSLLNSPAEVVEMPFLPLINETQIMYAQVQYLDFKNGSGVRYLTEFNQGIVPINNGRLFYTYQGISSDGKYYVAAVLPVNHPSLPAGDGITGNEPPEFSSDYLGYLASVEDALNSEPANTFTPDLTELDRMMRSLEIN